MRDRTCCRVTLAPVRNTSRVSNRMTLRCSARLRAPSCPFVALRCLVPCLRRPPPGAGARGQGGDRFGASARHRAAGMQVLAQGGNAFDAAVAVAAALAVVEPYLLRPGRRRILSAASRVRWIRGDDRCARHRTRPGAAAIMYFDADGKPDGQGVDGRHESGRHSWHAGRAGVARATLWTLPLRLRSHPAIRLAQDGFPTDARYAFVVGMREGVLQADPKIAGVFLDHGDAPGARLHRAPAGVGANAGGYCATAGATGFIAGDLARRWLRPYRREAASGNWKICSATRSWSARRTVSPIAARSITAARCHPPAD